jgi:tripartite-type tricarboxylate transporter receptor subunit TctC
MRRLFFALSIILAALSVVALPAAARAQTYPSRAIKLVVPFAAGGAVDALARVLGTKLAEGIGQSVIIENRPGAGGNLAAEAVAKSPPDGYTILQNTNGQTITPSLYRSLPFDAATDFTPVTQLVASNLILVASPKLPVKSLHDFIALAKAKPGSLNYGSSGIGNPLHLTMEMLKHATGIDIQPVPYRGDAQINAALITGEVQAAVVPLATAVQLVEDGRLTALGVTGGKRAAVLPDVPTIAEAGVPGFASTSWQGWFMPGKTPPEIVERIQRETVKVLALPDVQKALKAMAYEPVGSTPEDFAAFVKAETAKFARVVEDAHIPKQD